MALINGLYVFVEDEDWGRSVELTQHPVEQGLNVSDHVNKNATTVSLKGRIVGKNASTTMSQLTQMMNTGVLVKYVGRGTMSNCVITSFDTSHPNTIAGGMAFTAQITQVRIAKSAYKANSNAKTRNTAKAGTQQVSKKTSSKTPIYHTVKKGDTIWALVASSKAPYKSYGMSCDEVMKANQSAFSRKGDFRTLQIGEKIIVGYRK